jgi:anaerobic magnesium-protoporphyrin IX monomethyl ester cyclase
MLSILVCHSYFNRFDLKQRERAKPYPPLATLQVAAALRSAGHEVALFDAMLAESVDDFGRQVRRHTPQVVLLYEDNYNFLSKMCLARMREAACEMIGIAQVAGARILAAGSDASDCPEPYLLAGADIVLHGEGLATLFQLVARLDTHIHATRDELIAGLHGVTTLTGGATAHLSGVGIVPYPHGTSSTSSATGACGSTPMGISASTWRPRAGAPFAAPGAQSPSGETSTCNAIPPQWRRKWPT